MSAPLRRPGDARHDILHAWHWDTITQGLVPGGVRGAGQVCPPIREPLKPLTLQWSETPDQENRQCITAWLADQIGGILPLTGTLGGGGIVLSEFVHPLAAKNGVPGSFPSSPIRAAGTPILRLTLHSIFAGKPQAAA